MAASFGNIKMVNLLLTNDRIDISLKNKISRNKFFSFRNLFLIFYDTAFDLAFSQKYQVVCDRLKKYINDIAIK